MTEERTRRPQVFLWILFLCLTPVMVTPYVHSNDGSGYYAYVRSWIIDGDSDLKNEKAHLAKKYVITSIRTDPITKVTYSQYPIGTALLWLPFAALGHLVAQATSFPADGFSLPYVYLVNLGSAVYGFVGLLLTCSLISRYVSPRVAAWAVGTFWLSSSLLYYMYLEGTMSHAVSFFSTALFLWYWHRHRGRETARSCFVLGLLAALMIMVRYQNGLFLLAPGMDLLAAVFRDLKAGETRKAFWTAAGRGGACAVGTVMGCIPQALMLIYQHGTLFSLGAHYRIRVEGTSTHHLGWWIHRCLKVLFSQNHGLFYWTPVALLGFLGLLIGWKRRKEIRWMIGIFLAIFFAELLLVASINGWSAGQSYGHRMFVNMTLILSFGLAVLFESLERRAGRTVIRMLSVALVSWNLALMLQYGARLIPSEGPVSLRTVASNNVKVLPGKALKIIKTFLFSRSAYIP